MIEKENIVITGMARTPMGAFQGTLKDASCAELGAASIVRPWNEAVSEPTR